MVARRRQRLADFPLVGLRIIDLMPADACALVGGRSGAADQMDLAVKCHGRGSAARTRQWRNGRPLVGRHVVEKRIRIRIAVLFDETAERVNPAGIRHDGDVVGAARQWRGVEPPVVLRIVNMVIGAVDASLAIAADDMHSPRPGRSPRHFTSRQRQSRLGGPAALRALRRGTVHLSLADLLGREMMRCAALKSDERIGRGLCLRQG